MRDRTRDRVRHKRLETSKLLSCKGWLLQFWDAGAGWLIVFLIGISSALIAGVCVWVGMCGCVCDCAFLYGHLYIWYIYMHFYDITRMLSVSNYMCACMCKCVCVRACAHACVCTLVCICVCVHTRTYIHVYHCFLMTCPQITIIND